MVYEMRNQPHIVIVGGGVIGVSSAVALLDHPTSPCSVTLIASDLPSLDTSAYSPDSTQAAPSSYASAWAGAHHVSDAKTARQLRQDKVTFDVFQKLEKEMGFGSPNAALIWVHQTEYWERKEDFNADAIEWYPDYKLLPLSALPQGVELGCTLSTYDIVVPQYLPRLYRMFQSLGGRSINKKVDSISDALQLAREGTGSKPDVLLLSPGLGARDMLRDDSVHPVRGQTVLTRAPWCTTSMSKHTSWASNSPRSEPCEWPGMSRVNKDGFRDMYILPRGDGTFIVGGTRLVDDWDTSPRPKTTDDILQRALSFMPALVDPLHSPMSKNVDVVGVNVGLRPARRGGPRLERGGLVEDVPIIHSYGYGGFGYQCSWGAAFDVRDLIDDTLGRPRAPNQSTLGSLSPLEAYNDAGLDCKTEGGTRLDITGTL